MSNSQTEVPTRYLLQEQAEENRQGQGERKQKQQLEVGGSTVDKGKGVSRTFRLRANQRHLVSSHEESAKDYNRKESFPLDRQQVSNSQNLTLLPDDCLQTFVYMNQLKTIEKKQSSLTRQSRHILCKLASIMILICLFFITLLKVFLFFSTQFIATVIQSFKSQLFDPAITNDELELQIFYIQQACFLLTTVLLFLFVVFCTVMAGKYYVGSVSKYRRNKRVVKGLDQKKDHVKRRLQEMNKRRVIS